ncbi:MAG: hypothetical protein ACXVZR_12410 [Terriglobales bacterium]
MLAIAARRWGSIVPLLFVFLTLCASQLPAATCDQPAVAFKAGQLSVSSNGCSLQQTLSAIAKQTGIEVTMPPSAGAVPVFAVLGPGNPARVLSELLEGSPFNCTLTAKADGQGELTRVVLTERVAFVPDKAPAPTVAPAGGSSAAANKQASRGAERSLQARADDFSDQTKPRKEIDDDTLRKLPQLPPGIPSSMWNLFPSVVANGGVVPTEGRTPPSFQSDSSGSPSNSARPSNPYPQLTGPDNIYDPIIGPRGALNLPPLPPGVDPAIGRLYPWNLMQLIQNRQIQTPTVQLPPAPPMVPWH